jgi:hypothetical protein
MDDINNGYGGGVAAGATFQICFFLFYLALLLISCSDLMHMVSLMCMIKYASASVMLFSVIKFSRGNCLIF